MKIHLALLLVICGGSLVLLAEPADATTTCHATGNWCQGYAHVTTSTGGVASVRCFALRTTNTAPTCGASGLTPVNEATWEMNAGACITFYWFDTTNGAVPPAVPNVVNIQVRFDDSGTVVLNVLGAGAEPANGASYSFCATSTGVVGASPRAGTYRIYTSVIKNNGAGGVGNYNVDSDGVATVGAITSYDRGALRAKVVVASITRNAYPADSLFSYGTAGDESITVTGTFTQPNGDRNVECFATAVLDSATGTVGAVGATVDVDASTTLAQSFVVDSTFPLASGPYIQGLGLGCNALLTGMLWSVYASSGHGANIVIGTSTFAYDSTTFNIDPGVKFDSDGAGTYAAADDLAVIKVGSSSGAVVSVFNKGETFYSEWYVFNSRGEKLTRAMTFGREDSTPTTCDSGSITPSGAGLYTATVALSTGGTCTTTADTTGSPRFFRVTNTDQNHRSNQVFAVSSLLRFDEDGSGTPDNDVFTCLDACPATQVTVFNRGEAVDYDGYLINARGTQYSGTSVTWTAKDSLGATTNTQTITDTAGKYSGVFMTLSSTEKATADMTGDPHTFTATHNGNTANSASPVFGVSSLLFIDSHIEISGTLVKDDFPTENSAEDLAYIISTAQTDTTHGWCHVKTVRKDVNVDTSGSAVAWSYIDPLSATRASGTDDTGSDGWTPNGSPHNLLASTPLGAWTFRCVVAAFIGNAGTNDQGFTVGVPAGSVSGGFPGDPVRVFASPVLAVTGQTVTFQITESLIDGTARTGNAAATDVYVYSPSHAVLVSAAHPTEVAYGAYYYDYTAPATSGAYSIVVRTTDPTTMNPVGSSNGFYIQTGWATTTDAATIIAATDTLETSAASAATDLTTIKGYTDTLEASAATAATDLATIKGYTDTVEASLATMQTDLTTLKGYTDTLESGQATAQVDLTTIKGYTDSLEGSMTTALADLVTLKGYTDTLEASAATAAAAHTAAATSHTTIEGYTDTLEAGQAHADAHHHSMQATLDNLTINVTGNFTIDNETLNEILNNTYDILNNTEPAPLTAFETLTSTTGSEFAYLIFVVLAAIIIWSRSTDILVQFIMGVLPFIPAVIWMWLTVNGGWQGNIGLAVFSAGAGGYMMIRTGIDRFAKGA